MKEAKKNKQQDEKVKDIEANEVKNVDKNTKSVENAETDKSEKEKKNVEAGKKSKKSEKNEKKSKKGLVIFLVMLVVLVGGGFAAKVFLTKTTVVTETIAMADDVRGFSNYFREYLENRAEAEELFSYSFRGLKSEEILEKLGELKDGFSKVSRGVSGNYTKSAYKEMAEVMRTDADVYLLMIRELRAIMTESYPEEGDRQLAFMRKVEEESKKIRSALYIARAAFAEDVSGFSSKGVLTFDGKMMVEVGGGVANIFLGDFERNVVAVSTDDLAGAVKMIDAKKLYGYENSRLVEIGESISKELESGWFKRVEVELGNTEAKVKKTRISVVMKNAWGMDEELKAQGIEGLMETEKKSTEERLVEFLSGLEGKK